MVPEESFGPRVVRLKTGSVMCEVGTCTNEAEFLVRQGYDRVRAVCEAHLKALGVSDTEVPPQDTE